MWRRPPRQRLFRDQFRLIFAPDAPAPNYEVDYNKPPTMPTLAAMRSVASAPLVIYLTRPEPVPVGANVDPLGLSPGARVFPEAVIVIADRTVAGDVGDVTVGVVTATGGAELPTLPVMGNTLMVGTAGTELTPRLPIS